MVRFPSPPYAWAAWGKFVYCTVHIDCLSSFYGWGISFSVRNPKKKKTHLRENIDSHICIILSSSFVVKIKKKTHTSVSFCVCVCVCGYKFFGACLCDNDDNNKLFLCVQIQSVVCWLVS